MNAVRPVAVLLVWLLPVGGLAQTPPDRPLAPTLPPGSAGSERFSIERVTLLAEQGRFEDAEAHHRPYLPAVPAKVFADVTAVVEKRRADVLAALRAAVAAWNAGLEGPPSFVETDKVDGADVVVEFRPTAIRRQGSTAVGVCGSARLDVIDGRRVVRATVALGPPGAGTDHTVASLTHLAGQGLGAYLGVDATKDPTGFMRPDTHAPGLAVKPSEAEIRTARELRSVRARLLELAQKRIAPHVPRPALSLDRTSADAGSVWSTDKPRFTFVLKNTGDAPMTVTATPNCGCTVASFDKSIPPGGSGKVEADLSVATFKGRITKTVDLITDDPKHPRTVLQLSATIRTVVTVLPGENVSVRLKPSGPTVQELTVKLDDDAPAELIELKSGSPFATAKFVSFGPPGTYRASVTIRPDLPLGRVVIPLAGTTTSKRGPKFQVNLICEKGILVSPSTTNLGLVNAGPTSPAIRNVTLMKRDGEFRLKKVTTDDPKLEARPTPVKEGSMYRLVLTYRGGWPAGPVRRVVSVETDDPDQPRIEIPVTATVPGPR